MPATFDNLFRKLINETTISTDDNNMTLNKQPLSLNFIFDDDRTFSKLRENYKIIDSTYKEMMKVLKEYIEVKDNYDAKLGILQKDSKEENKDIKEENSKNVNKVGGKNDNSEIMLPDKNILHELLTQLHDYFQENKKIVSLNKLISEINIKKSLFSSIFHIIEFNKKYSRDLISLIEMANNVILKQNEVYKIYIKYYTEIEKIYKKKQKENPSIYEINIALSLLQFDIKSYTELLNDKEYKNFIKNFSLLIDYYKKTLEPIITKSYNNYNELNRYYREPELLYLEKHFFNIYTFCIISNMQYYDYIIWKKTNNTFNEFYDKVLKKTTNQLDKVNFWYLNYIRDYSDAERESIENSVLLEREEGKKTGSDNILNMIRMQTKIYGGIKYYKKMELNIVLAYDLIYLYIKLSLTKIAKNASYEGSVNDIYLTNKDIFYELKRYYQYYKSIFISEPSFLQNYPYSIITKNSINPIDITNLDNAIQKCLVEIDFLDKKHKNYLERKDGILSDEYFEFENKFLPELDSDIVKNQCLNLLGVETDEFGKSIKIPKNIGIADVSIVEPINMLVNDTVNLGLASSLIPPMLNGIGSPVTPVKPVTGTQGPQGVHTNIGVIGQRGFTGYTGPQGTPMKPVSGTQGLKGLKVQDTVYNPILENIDKEIPVSPITGIQGPPMKPVTGTQGPQSNLVSGTQGIPMKPISGTQGTPMKPVTGTQGIPMKPISGTQGQIVTPVKQENVTPSKQNIPTSNIKSALKGTQINLPNKNVTFNKDLPVINPTYINQIINPILIEQNNESKELSKNIREMFMYLRNTGVDLGIIDENIGVSDDYIPGYTVLRNEGGGDCFFAAIRDAFNGDNIYSYKKYQQNNIIQYVSRSRGSKYANEKGLFTVQGLRNAVADNFTQDNYDSYSNSAPKDMKTASPDLIAKFAFLFNQDGSKKTLEEVREQIRLSCVASNNLNGGPIGNYWGDEFTISLIEIIFQIKLFIFDARTTNNNIFNKNYFVTYNDNIEIPTPKKAIINNVSYYTNDINKKVEFPSKILDLKDLYYVNISTEKYRDYSYAIEKLNTYYPVLCNSGTVNNSNIQDCIFLILTEPQGGAQHYELVINNTSSEEYNIHKEFIFRSQNLFPHVLYWLFLTCYRDIPGNNLSTLPHIGEDLKIIQEKFVKIITANQSQQNNMNGGLFKIMDNVLQNGGQPLELQPYNAVTNQINKPRIRSYGTRYSDTVSPNTREQSKLSYYVIVDLNIIEKGDWDKIPIDAQIKMRCNSTKEKVRKAYADMFGFRYEPLERRFTSIFDSDDKKQKDEDKEKNKDSIKRGGKTRRLKNLKKGTLRKK